MRGFYHQRLRELALPAARRVVLTSWVGWRTKDRRLEMDGVRFEQAYERTNSRRDNRSTDRKMNPRSIRHSNQSKLKFHSRHNESPHVFRTASLAPTTRRRIRFRSF